LDYIILLLEKEETNTLSTCEAQIYSQQEKKCISNKISNINKFNKMIISVTNIWHTQVIIRITTIKKSTFSASNKHWTNAPLKHGILMIC
jgi:hypothetical protein